MNDCMERDLCGSPGRGRSPQRTSVPLLLRVKVFASTLGLALGLGAFLPEELVAQNQPPSHYETALLAQDTYPIDASGMNWFPDDHEVQGLTNDGKFWFFTIVDQDKTYGLLWRIPKSMRLAGDVSRFFGARSVSYFDVPDLVQGNHWHWGDPDHVRFEGVDYIIIPIYTIVACFRADNLAYVNYANLDSRVYAGWCAVGADLDLYASENNPTAIERYDVDWARLVYTKEHDCIKHVRSYSLTEADGSPLYMTDMQGGEFTSSGELLYLVSGRGYCAGNGAPWSPRDGVHVIDTHRWREVARSVKNSGADIPFSYNYDPTCMCCGPLCFGGVGTETPEGVTVWDLEDGGAPNIRGSVHVLIDRYWIAYGCNDGLTLHHFSSRLHVDPLFGGNGPGLRGRRDNPFRSLSEAYSYFPIWDGAELMLKAGVYREEGRFEKRIRLASIGGTAVIGR